MLAFYCLLLTVDGASLLPGMLPTVENKKTVCCTPLSIIAICRGSNLRVEGLNVEMANHWQSPSNVLQRCPISKMFALYTVASRLYITTSVSIVIRLLKLVVAATMEMRQRVCSSAGRDWCFGLQLLAVCKQAADHFAIDWTHSLVRARARARCENT